MKPAEQWSKEIREREFSDVGHIKAIQLDAIKEGLQRFAWWKDGEQYVGTCGTTLKQALKDAENL